MHTGNYSLKEYEKKYPLAVECIRHLKLNPSDRKQFHQRLRQRRLQLNITKAELTSALGITTRSWDYYEQGQRLPRPHILFKMAVILKIGIRALSGCKI